jgi:RND superfamily putative drug exporter
LSHIRASDRVPTGTLARWARFCASHPWRVVTAWIAILVLLVGSVAAFGGKLRDEFKIPGSDVQKGQDLIDKKFVTRKGATLNIVLAAPAGQRLDTPERKAAIATALQTAKGFGTQDGKPGVIEVDDPFTQARFSDKGRIAYAEARFNGTGFDIPRSKVVDLQKAVRADVAGAGIQAEFNGDAEQPPIKQGTSETLGLLAAFIVLLLVFRTFVATFIPIVLAIVAVGAAFMLLFLGAAITDFNTITPILVSMIGLGVGIDYSLFIVTRFRQLLHEGLSPADAATGAGASAGRAVIFAGLTVAISITGLAFIGLDFITKLGVGSALGVLTTVLIANSLLISVLRLLGHKVDRLKVPFLRAQDDSEEARERTPIARWGRFVTRNAKIVLPVGLIALLIVAASSLAVRLGASDQGTAPKNQTARKAYDLLAEGFGPGFNGPVPIVVDVRGDKGAPARIAAAAKGLPGVARVEDPIFNKPGDVALVNIVPTAAPQDKAADELVSNLRDNIVPKALDGSNARAYVSGSTAAFRDIGDRILSRMPYFLLYIIGVTFLLLAMGFRSVVIAGKAAITTIMSAFVGFGVLTFIIQEGHLLGLTGLDRTGPIETFVPPIAFAILFGLSMDYEVFLMSRIREEHVHGLKTRDAVEHGIAAIGRVIVAAALIMSVVFGAFVLGSDRVSKEFGLLLAVAILTDALVVRMTLVPAFLTILGERSWAMPRWLDRVLPDITIEPPHDHEAHDRAHGSRGLVPLPGNE